MTMTKRETRLVAAAAALAAAVVAVGAAVHAASGGLGVATPPFVMSWGPRSQPWWTVGAAAALVALVWGAPRLATLRAAPAFAFALPAASAVVALTVNAARGGTHAWYRVFDLGPGGSFEAGNEILAGRPAFSYGPRYFLDRFAELVPSQPVHQAGHPPGLPVLLDLTGIVTAPGLAALCAVALAGLAPATWALARSLDLGEPAARRAGLLALASPVAVLFGVTSPDAIFALAGAGAAALLCAATAPRRAAGAALLGLGSLLSWALLGVGAWAVLVAALRRGPRAGATLGLACATAVVGAQGGLALATGYDPIGTLQATGEVYRAGIAGTRPYAFWLFGAPVAFALTAGPVLAGAAVVGAARRQAPAVALVAVLGLSAVLGFTKAENERIWLQYLPLLCVAAAPALTALRLRVVLASLAAQALATSLLFDTIW